VAPTELVRAFEVGEDQFVNITDQDLEQLPLPSQHTIELLAFVHAAEIDPIYFDSSYYVEPEAIGVKSYALLLKVLERKAMIGIAKIAIGDEESLCAVRPRGEMFVLHTLHHSNEVREPNFYLPTVLVGDPEIAIGSSLVDMLEEPFDPSAYPNGYREALLELIERKIQGEEIVVPAKVPSTTATDLTTALQESVEAVRQGRHGFSRRHLGRARPIRRIGGAPAES
jgi:DNA end-binding protein Ku